MLRRNDAKGFRGFDFVFGAIVGLYGNWLISFILKFKFEGSDFFIFISGILLTSALTFFVYTVHLVFVPKSKKLLMVSLFTHTFFGWIGLLYGYVCFSGRNNPIPVKGEDS